MSRHLPPPLLVALLLLPAGCGSLHKLGDSPSPAAMGLSTTDLTDPPAQAEADARIESLELLRVADRVRESVRASAPPPACPCKRSVLALSGGGSYGAYSAGLIVGWTQTGTRPAFDVVTGISTGALIAPFAFLGPDYDAKLREFYTTLHSKDLYRVRRSIRALLLSESLADNGPLAKKVDETITAELLQRIAVEHGKGRRLYVGTTELEGRRFVVWDMGAIAARGTPADLVLFRKVLLGSSAIPGFFPPAQIPVIVDGRGYTERHVDGGTTTALFFKPPYVPPDQLADPAARTLAGADVYAIVAGKLYPDADTTRPWALTIAASSVSTVLAAQTRGDLTRLFTLCLLTGMNYHMAAIPAAYPAPASCTEFDPAVMTKMFDEGVRQVCEGTAWRTTPPGAAPGESALTRTGTWLHYEPGRGKQ